MNREFGKTINNHVSSVLFDEPPLLVTPKLATLLGVNAAIFLQQVRFWLNKSDHVIDGRTWIFNSLDDWHQQLPFWSMRTLTRIIADLEKSGVLLSGNF